MDPLLSALRVSASGLEAESTRLRIVSENIANARSTGDTPGTDPYRRKTVSFAAEIDRVSGASTVEVQRLGTDDSEFTIEFDPGNPAADDKGMVKIPNVNVLMEMADMREANRSYEANLQTTKQARDLISATIDLLRASAIMINAIETISSAISNVKDVSSTSNTSSAQAILGGAAGAAPTQSFADVMSSMASEMNNSLRASEAASIQGIRGQANTREVVDAVMHAEQSLQTAIAIRDKVISAYLEIARMPI